MTCVSPRSGRASRGTVRRAQSPAAHPNAARMKMISLFRTEKSMTRSIMGRRRPQPALGIDEERPRGHHALTWGETAHDLDALRIAPSGDDGPRLELSLAPFDEDLLRAAGIHQR